MTIFKYFFTKLLWFFFIPGLTHQLSSASTHSLPSRIDQLTDGEDEFEEDEDSSSALDPYDDSTPTNTSPEVILSNGRKYSSW